VEPQYPNGIDFAGLSAAAQQHDRDGSRNASSGTCNRDEEKNSARGRTSLAPPSKRGAWTAGKTPNPRIDLTPRASMRCPLAAGPRPRLSDIQAAEGLVLNGSAMGPRARLRSH
jgi:hypothetical protein